MIQKFFSKSPSTQYELPLNFSYQKLTPKMAERIFFEVRQLLTSSLEGRQRVIDWAKFLVLLSFPSSSTLIAFLTSYPDSPLWDSALCASIPLLGCMASALFVTWVHKRTNLGHELRNFDSNDRFLLDQEDRELKAVHFFMNLSIAAQRAIDSTTPQTEYLVEILKIALILLILAPALALILLLVQA